jgi:ABC-type multidrug transport system ATPase subunit
MLRARQLIYLARAILAKPKILLIDELSFDLDADNWGLIQEILRTEFKETTILQVCTS